MYAKNIEGSNGNNILLTASCSLPISIVIRTEITVHTAWFS